MELPTLLQHSMSAMLATSLAPNRNVEKEKFVGTR
jgi:hypothetical protein